MTTQEVADRLVSLCREGKFDEVYQELYSPDCWSIEPEGNPFGGPAKGMEEIQKKGAQWQEMLEQVNSSEIGDPIVAENFFSVSWKMNATLKGNPEPVQMDEICVFNVVDGKVVKEQFFYTPMG